MYTKTYAFAIAKRKKLVFFRDFLLFFVGKVGIFDGKSIRGLRTGRFTDDRGGQAQVGNGLPKRLGIRSVDLVCEGQMLLFPRRRPFNLGEVTVQIAGNGVTECLTDLLKDRGIIGGSFENTAKVTGIEGSSAQRGFCFS